MHGPNTITAPSRRAFLAGALLVSSAGKAAAQIRTPVETPPPPSTPTQKAAEDWITYEARLRSRLADAGGGAFKEGFARDLLAKVNVFRNSNTLADYVWDDDLALCARAHAADMAQRDYFGHSSPEGFTHLERAALLCRSLCGKTAENLAWRSYSTGTTPDDMQSLWENSPGHRDNLLREGFASAGYGVVQVGDTYYAAGVYANASVRLARPLPLWVQNAPDVETAIVGASPNIDQMSVTAPFQQPTWTAPSSGKIPSLAQGAWQLRPLKPTGSGRLSVVSGPLFFVG